MPLSTRREFASVEPAHERTSQLAIHEQVHAAPSQPKQLPPPRHHRHPRVPASRLLAAASAAAAKPSPLFVNMNASEPVAQITQMFADHVSLPTIGYRFLMPILPDFAARYPEVELDLDFDDRILDVIEEGLDVVVRSGETLRKIGRAHV